MDMASGSAKLVFQLCITLAGLRALAQPGAKPLEFEIASVKPADPSIRTSNVLLGAGESLIIVNVPLRKIIMYAYDIRDFQLAGGAGWVGYDRYDIIAKTATATRATFEAGAETDDQRRDRVARVRERTPVAAIGPIWPPGARRRKKSDDPGASDREGRPETRRSIREHRKSQHG
jgi:hypothetical protein